MQMVLLDLLCRILWNHLFGGGNVNQVCTCIISAVLDYDSSNSWIRMATVSPEIEILS
jgi:hypothetical protein